MTTCPVCGKGETDELHIGFDPASGSKSGWIAYAAYYPTRFDYTPVSHLACVASQREESMLMKARYQEAELEAAFWKWLWHQSTQTTATDGFDNHPWFAHMRERWEREEG
jgi:hypothetical protein